MKLECLKRGWEFLRVLKNTSLDLTKLETIRSPDIHYFSDGLEVSEQGQIFIKLPEELARTLPNTFIPPDSFLQEFRQEIDSQEKRKLLGDYVFKDGEYAFASEESNFNLKIFHGSTNPYALNLSKYADLDPNDPQRRMYYQDNLSSIVEPLVKTETDAPLRIVEDCLASGDTLPSVIKTLAEITKLKNGLGKVTVDVSVATAQGIFLLKKFAQDNKIDIDLNVGFLAFGLSEGIKREIGYEHANYIIYHDNLVEKLTELFAERNKEISALAGKQVVGDMGEYGKILPGINNDQIPMVAPWNEFRADSHGSETNGPFTQPIYDESFNQHILYLSNGGYLMRAFYHYFNNRDKKNKFSEVVFSAKRRWTKEYGYGALLKDIPAEIML